MSYPITPVVRSARAAPQKQFLDAPCNIFPTPETFSLSNASTILVIVLTNTQLLISSGISLASETFFISAEPISDLNNRLLSKKLLKIVFSYIQQKQPTTYKRKVSNLHKVVIDSSLSNT